MKVSFSPDIILCGLLGSSSILHHTVSVYANTSAIVGRKGVGELRDASTQLLPSRFALGLKSCSNTDNSWSVQVLDVVCPAFSLCTALSPRSPEEWPLTRCHGGELMWPNHIPASSSTLLLGLRDSCRPACVATWRRTEPLVL